MSKWLKVSDLSPGEKLLTLRRRMKLTQAQMANKYGVTLVAYRDMELDADYIRGNREVPSVNLGGRLAAHEVAVILRFRSGMSQAEMAIDIGLSKHWLRKMEINAVPNDRLLEYWGIA